MLRLYTTVLLCNSNYVGARTKTVLSGSKSPPKEGNCALVHRADTGTAHVYSHDRTRLIEHLVRSKCTVMFPEVHEWYLGTRVVYGIHTRYELITAGTTCSAVTK
jgi:hypothetical protein